MKYLNYILIFCLAILIGILIGYLPFIKSEILEINQGIIRNEIEFASAVIMPKYKLIDKKEIAILDKVKSGIKLNIGQNLLTKKSEVDLGISMLNRYLKANPQWAGEVLGLGSVEEMILNTYY